MYTLQKKGEEMLILKIIILLGVFASGFLIGTIRQIDKHDDEVVRYETDNHRYNIDPIDYYANMDCASRPVKKRKEN